MNKVELVNKITRTCNRIGFKFKKHGPEILVAVGVIGTVTSAVMACKATTKVSDILDETHEALDKLHRANEKLANGETVKLVTGEEYTIEDVKKDTVITYAQTGFKFVKLYGPSVLLGAISITSILAGHKILRKRNIALAAAYAAVDKGFKEYRGRVIERFGKDLDHELRYNIKAQEVESIEVDKNGKEKIVKTTTNVVDPTTIGDFSRIFDADQPGWNKDPELTMLFLKGQERYLNELLQERGHVFLNEVFDALGFPRTTIGSIVGWIYDEKCPNGDNFIDFGIFKQDRQANVNFINGYERSILLDFNCDGVIYNLI